MKNQVLIAAFFALFLTSCSTISTSYDYDKSVDFSKYKTYTLFQESIDQLKVNDLDKRRIIVALKEQLALKGLVEQTTGTADLKVNVLASSKDKIDVNTTNYGGPWGWGYGWGYGYGPSSTTVDQYKEGKLVYHLVDNKTNNLIWEGSGEGILAESDKKEQQITEATQKIFSKYPPASK